MAMKRFAALAEVLFVLLAANLFVLLLKAAGLTPALLGVDAETAALDTRTGLVEGLFVALKFGFAIALGLGLLRTLRGIRPQDVGLTRAGRSLSSLAMRGVALGAVAGLPWLVLMTANAFLPFGSGVSGWQRIESAELDAGFLVYVLATMVILPPVLEECAVRGYMRGRLQVSFGPVGAAVLSSLVFVLAHGHFYGRDAVLVGSQVTLVYAFAVVAYDTYRSGSVLPAIVAHALLNLPVSRDRFGMSVALLLAVLIVLRARYAVGLGLTELRGDWQATADRSGVGLWAAAGAGLMIATMLFRPAALLLVAFALAGTVVSVRLAGRARPRRYGVGE